MQTCSNKRNDNRDEEDGSEISEGGERMKTSWLLDEDDLILC